MLVDRRILNVARDKTEDALTLLAEEKARLNWKGQVRIYRPVVAEFDQVVFEIEFADWAEMDEFENGWQADGAEAFFTTWADVALPGGRRELWETME